MSSLLCHKDCQIIAPTHLDALRKYKPQPTYSYQPLDYSTFVDTIQEFFDDNGFELTKLQIASSVDKNDKFDGRKIFGILEVTRDDFVNSDFQPAIGFRSSWDRTIAPEIIGGGSIFVCDNLVFRGDVEGMYHRQTPGINFGVSIYNACKKIMNHFKEMTTDFKQFKQKSLTDDKARSIVLEAMLRDIVSPKQGIEVYKEYLEPSYIEFQPGNLYSLNNAFTHKAKLLPETHRFETLVGVGKLCREIVYN